MIVFGATMRQDAYTAVDESCLNINFIYNNINIEEKNKLYCDLHPVKHQLIRSLVHIN